MRVALYVTCLVDLMRPGVGFAALKLLEEAGCQVVVPPGQTCCGQPAASAGDRPNAIHLAKKLVAELEAYEQVVVPSGSCALHIRQACPELLADDTVWAVRARSLAERVYELTDFLSRIVGYQPAVAAHPTCVTYHDSCKGLRGLGIRDQPRQLLAAAGHRLQEMSGCEECCGFGGAFSLQQPEVSVAIADRKAAMVLSSGAQVLVGGDLGCLLNIQGRLMRRGDGEQLQVMHVAELLAGEGK